MSEAEKRSSINLSVKTIEQLKQLGHIGETLEDVVVKLLDEHRQLAELRKV